MAFHIHTHTHTRTNVVLLTGEVTRALVAAGAKLEVTNSQGLSPLGSAVVSNNSVAAAALLKNGANGAVLARG